MLGIAKHTFNVWLQNGVLLPNQLLLLDERKRKLKLPLDIERIPHNISKAYKSMKADEWKHWTLVYSMFSLQGIMSQDDLNIWCLFVNACHIMCRRDITLNEIGESHALLNMFCDQFQRKYGSQNCVRNMHMSLHLKHCIKDFERFNGILGKFHTNNNDISLKVMRKLVSGSQL